ncbi:hypothetical protein UlMin_040780 [Ulmus minor]
MASTSFLPSTLNLSYNPFSENPKPSSDRRKRRLIFAGHDQNYRSSRSRLVDENMIILRKRIHEMKMVERNYEPPSDWMEWEKKYYTSYDAIICQAMGLLQSQMMNTRPSLVLGMVFLILLSLPVSTSLVFSHLMQISQGLLA